MGKTLAKCSLAEAIKSHKRNTKFSLERARNFIEISTNLKRDF